MCGIFGCYAPNIKISADKAVQSIAHRGPDDAGFLEANGLTLGHRRLSILDLSPNGHQPMLSEDGRFAIVYNGEIYNHWDIRTALEGKYDFRSTSDTETLLYGFIEYGEAVLNKLNGIFAFAIFDRKTNRLFIARDQMGIKPLYYYWDGATFAFCSEIKGLIQLEQVDRSLRPEAFVNYLHFLWSPGEMTPLKYVQKLLPGHYLDLQLEELPAKLAPTRYYDIPFNGNYSAQSEAALTDELEERLLRAVGRQLLSDVPVGFFLSGGLDSSLLVAMAKKLHPEQRWQCFTIDTSGMEEAEGFVSDLHYARKVASHLDVQLEVVDAWPDIPEFFDAMVWHLDEPQADPAPLNVLKICERAQEMGYKVLIGGAAGDDLFSGYRRHQALRWEPLLNSIPAGLAGLLSRLLAPLGSAQPTVRRVRKLLKGAGQTPDQRLLSYFSWLDTDRIKSLFADSLQLNGYDPDAYLRQLLETVNEEPSSLNRLLYLELRSFLVDHNLNYTDKLSMATSVEVRVPYLDMELVEFSTRIPPGLKLKGNTTKYLLRKVAERYLPREVIYRPKAGFGAPVRQWITKEMRHFVAERLSQERLKNTAIFNPEAVEQLIRDNEDGRIDASYSIWALMAIVSWHDQFIKKAAYSQY
ncbi:MAG: asparagine synthase (glutamine-hydrolyzing) [Lewinellaceae bacterium]|nr:asparagine synthase (glutamine-hydrolyzing) [Phaeodactylibacter sp.]MCB9036095.1 asparagine synthase (glutamine-hydrolyzing) [Lewinellaceae bacterium]